MYTFLTEIGQKIATVPKSFQKLFQKPDFLTEIGQIIATVTKSFQKLFQKSDQNRSNFIAIISADLDNIIKVRIL